MTLYLLAYILPIVIVVQSLPMVLGLVPPNRFFGFRTPKTLSSPEIWYSANRASGWFMIAAAAVTICVNSAILSLGADWGSRTLFWWVAAANVIALTMSLAVSFLYLRRV